MEGKAAGEKIPAAPTLNETNKKTLCRHSVFLFALGALSRLGGKKLVQQPV